MLTLSPPQYDNIPVLSIVGSAPISPSYEGFNFFACTGYRASDLGGLIPPESEPNVALSGLRELLLTGETMPGFAIAPPGKSLDLDSLFIACAVDDESVGRNIPIGCAIRFTAKTTSGAPSFSGCTTMLRRRCWERAG